MHCARHIGLTGALFVCFVVGAPVVQANTINLSSDPYFASQFFFYCAPYTSSFEPNKHYIVQNGQCTYSIPATISGKRHFLLMKGVPGVGATLIGGDTGSYPQTLTAQYPNVFDSPAVDDQFFAAIYETSLDQGPTPFIDYLSGASPTIPAGAVLGQNYYLMPWRWGPKPVEDFEPVVVVPGILGSWKKDGVWLLDPVLHTYENLLDTLRANGYVDGETLFSFGYDWEQSNIDTAYQLGQKIQEIKNVCGCSKVDVIAHSMGGLATEYYIEKPDYQRDIDDLILLSVPQAGAPLAYKAWEGGEFDLGKVIYNSLAGIKFYLEARHAGYSSIFDYIRGKPILSVQELLPTYSYLRTSTTTLVYPVGHPVNGFLEALQTNLPAQFVSGHFSFLGARVTMITAGWQDTQTGYRVAYTASSTQKWEHGEPTETIVGDGDGTAPFESLEYMLSPNKMYPGDDHSSVASSSAGYIFETFNNRKPDIIVGKMYNPITSFLYIALFSPLDMQIVSPDGKRLGKDFANDTEWSEIPDAFYSGFSTDNEYVIIPNPLPGEYKVETVGTGGGEYTIVASYFDLASSTQTEVTGATTLGEVINHTLALSPTTTVLVIVADTPPPTEITPKKCAEDVEESYQKQWITKHSIYTRLTAECRTLGELFKARDSMERSSNKNKKHFDKLVWGINASIKTTLDRMEKLVNKKSNTQEAKDLLTQDITWFRENELD